MREREKRGKVDEKERERQKKTKRKHSRRHIFTYRSTQRPIEQTKQKQTTKKAKRACSTC